MEEAVIQEAIMGAPPEARNVLSGQVRTATAFFVALTVVFLISALYHPATGDYFTICIFKNITGLPCPGCGLTHSFCSLAKGQVWDAFRFNGLGPLLFLAFFCVWIRQLLVLLGRWNAVYLMDEIQRKIALTKLFLIGFLVYGVGRIGYILIFARSEIHKGPVFHSLLSFLR